MISSLWGTEKLWRAGQNFLANYVTPVHRWSGITVWMNCLSLWKALNFEAGTFVGLIVSYTVCDNVSICSNFSQNNNNDNSKCIYLSCFAVKH